MSTSSHLIEFVCIICRERALRSPAAPWEAGLDRVMPTDRICFDCFAATFSNAARPINVLVIARGAVKPEAGAWATRDDGGQWRIGLKSGRVFEAKTDLVNEEFGCAY